MGISIKKIKNKVMNKVENRYVNFCSKREYGKKVSVSISDMYFMQIKNSELMRYDMIVRYLAIENYYGKNNYGWNLYEKMQNARKGQGYSKIAVEKFKNLISSYDEKGYDKSSFILADEKLGLMDGSHRMAMGLYHGIRNINVLVVKNINKTIDYSIDWFFKNGFNLQEISYIIQKEKILREEINVPFSCVIWSPAVELEKEILQDLSYYGTILNTKRYEYKGAEYENIVKAIYAIDDIKEWKIEKKIEYMKNRVPALISIDLKLDNPDFRIKKISHQPISKMGERIKKVIREKYKLRVENYFFDIIFHMGDNFRQSKYMRYVFEPNIDMVEIIDVLKRYHYAFVKIDVPYMPVAFPNKIPVGKDADILCLEEDYLNIKKDILKIVNCNKYEAYDIHILESNNNTRIRFEMDAKLIYQIDIGWKIPDNLNELFIKDALNEVVYEHNLSRLKLEYELMYRWASYCEKKNKEHHLIYIKKYIDLIDITLAKKYIVNYDEFIRCVKD